MKQYHFVSLIVTTALLGILVVGPGLAYAVDRYVTDSFEIMVRSGPRLENKIVKVLRSGAEVDVIDGEAGDGYSEVRMEDGDIGFVLTRLLTPDPVARDQLAALKQTLEELQGDPESIEARLTEAQEKNVNLVVENSDLSMRVQEMSEELARIGIASENAVRNASENEKLQLEVDQLTLEFDDLRLQNRAYRDQSDKKWFIVGALTLLGGIIIGLIIPALRKNRQGSWSRY
jgi:SH3 domain protein